MQEFAEFRIPEDEACKHLEDSEGSVLGGFVSVRKLFLNTSEPRFAEIGEIDAKYQSLGRAFFTCCIIRRKYGAAELDSATLFQLKVKSLFEPAGEECGTVYDETAGCPKCGSGAKQISPLYLPKKRIPKSKDFCKTIAGEIVVSSRAAELFHSYGISGAQLTPVMPFPASSTSANNWYQMRSVGYCLDLVPPTRVGVDPFDDDVKGEYRCSCGKLLGLGLLSEVTVRYPTGIVTDIAWSNQFIGVRRGLLRPERALLVSQKFRKMVESEKLKGVGVEVAHVVEGTGDTQF